MMPLMLHDRDFIDEESAHISRRKQECALIRIVSRAPRERSFFDRIAPRGRPDYRSISA
jgi:hypothetical protein